MPHIGPILVKPREGEALVSALARALDSPAVSFEQLAQISELLLRDGYLAEQVQMLHAYWAITPPPATSLIARLRRWLAWKLCEPELAQINATHATLTRIVESLIAHLDAERTARQKLAEQVAALEARL
ncbi:hypothetical protein [uncultured Chloroflexus sp.]|uniref:hypothetical protein n=1 Tax=uncultured Chloroflexus sp. TaxID=214040 RepID=UPI0026074DEE|nr:hypothetical protein [uncultured Chloroflexus sp.]